jgi:hypothetical protein
MKNRKFVGKEGFEAIAWDIEVYTSRLFEDKPCFWAEFSYTSGHSRVDFDLDTAKIVYAELGKFLVEATKKEAEFKSKQKKAKK